MVALTLGIGVLLSVGACSSDDEDGPPASETPVTVAEDVAESTAPDTSDSVPSTGLVSIDGPATVDSAFTGANQDGDEGDG
jgi:hypothetical protein